MIRRFPILTFGLLLTVIMTALDVYRPEFIVTLHNYGYDTLVRRFHKEVKADAVAIVDIDEKSMAELGQWPWPRYVIADILKAVQQGGARVIALDMVFPEKDRTSPTAIQQTFSDRYGEQISLDHIDESLKDYDHILAEQLGRMNSVLGCYMLKKKPQDPYAASPEEMDPYFRSVFLRRGEGDFEALVRGERIPDARNILFSIPEIRRAAKNNAFFNAKPDFDNVVRVNPLIMAYGPKRVYPSVALEALRQYLGVEIAMLIYDENGMKGIRLKDHFIPTNMHGELPVNFRKIYKTDDGVPRTFPTYSVQDVLNGDIPADAFSNKIVFLGTSAVGLRDLRSTPLTQGFSGVEVHANIVDNVLSGDMLLDPYGMRLVHFLSILGAGILITLIVRRYRSWIAFLFLLAVLGASFYISAYLFQRNIVYVPTYLALTVVILYPVLTMMKFWKQESHERWIKERFGAMVSNDVLSYLEAHPDEIQRGKKTEATILFCDIQGFTSFSEKLPPEKVASFLNKFFSPMTEIILRRNGYIDKYIGDMIMAVWGAPFPSENSALAACSAAHELLEKLKEIKPQFKEEFDIDLNIRIGLNTGTITAGNMGSEQRYEYTVIGEAVNVAARLEPLNKQYDTNCIIGQRTRELAGDAIEAKKLDDVQVRGKTETLAIYELVNIKA